MVGVEVEVESRLVGKVPINFESQNSSPELDLRILVVVEEALLHMRAVVVCLEAVSVGFDSSFPVILAFQIACSCYYFAFGFVGDCILGLPTQCITK